MSDQSQRITGLSPEKRELLLRRLKQKSDGTRRSISSQSRANASFPLSFAQQRLWFLNQLQPDSPFYNVPDSYRLTGRLDGLALEASFDRIVRRHEVLRTTFEMVDGEPRQLINPPAPFVLRRFDLSGLDKAAREAEMLRRADEEAKRLFDLRRDPMLRASLLRLAEEEHVLLMSMHHIASDGWSRSVLMSELTTLYEALSAGREPSLPELPVQYADFAVWQREHLSGDVLAEQLDYWRARLGGELPVLDLLTDRPRPPIPSHRGAYYNIAFPAHIGTRMNALSRESGATLFMALLAAFQALLFRYTGQASVAVGTPVAGRSRAEIEHLIGFFVNMLVLRTDLSGNPTFRELLQRVRQVALGAYAHADVPFEKLVEELHPRRDMSRNPLFQVAFALQNAPAEEFALSGLNITPLEVGSESSRFDIECHLWETPEGLGGGLIYSTDLFDEATIARLVSHYQRLLETVTGAPDTRLSDLPLLTAAEQQQILFDWNDTNQPYPSHLCLHQLFEAQAARTPEREALRWGERRITYGELNARADKVAHHLRAGGTGPEVLVGLLVERNIGMVVALLGILKAGGAYVPLDPAYPQERLAFMLKDAGVSVLLAQEHLAAYLPDNSARVVLLDAVGTLAGAPDAESQPAATGAHALPGNLAYIIYTSGSTGRPKGVCITHESAVAFIAWATGQFTPAELSGTLASTSICFDLSVFEIFAPLACGGCVLLAENALALPALPAAHEVTLVNTVPSAMAELVRSGDLPASIETINLAGEPLKGSLVEEIYSRTRARRVFNLYGPSEDTTYSTFSLVERERGREPAIGRPITNGEVYLLDAHLRPVPVGVAGELHVGGKGLARGYLDRPELTAEKFIPHPFSRERGARLYRTGDVARFLPGGELEFIGRIDSQVKIRGFRVELGEIEVTLGRHGGVREAAVIAREQATGDKRLVAYVVPEREATLSVSALRTFLRERLPEHMIPSGFIMLEEMPLTANGKVNRLKLQALAESDAARQTSFVLPRDALELQLAQIWEEVLGTRRVGVRDNFFESGGHSLLAVRLMSQLRRRFERDLPLAVLMRAQTIEELAAVLRDESASAVSSVLVPIRPAGSRPPFFCVHPVGGGVMCYLDLARRIDAQHPFYGLQAPGLETGDAPLAKIEELAASYLGAVRGVQPAGPYLLGGWSLGGVIAFEMARQLHAHGESVALVALIDSHAPRGVRGAWKPDDNELFLQMFADDLGRLCGVELMPAQANSHDETLDRRLEQLLRRAVESGALPAGVELEQVRRPFNLFRANVQALASYQPEPYRGRLTLLRATEQFAETETDGNNGWSRLAAGELDLHEVPGDHYTMIKPPHVDALSERLNTCLAEALAERGTQLRTTDERSAASL